MNGDIKGAARTPGKLSIDSTWDEILGWLNKQSFTRDDLLAYTRTLAEIKQARENVDTNRNLVRVTWILAIVTLVPVAKDVINYILQF